MATKKKGALPPLNVTSGSSSHSRRMLHGPAAASGSWLQMHILRPGPGPPNQKLEKGLCDFHFNQSSS